MRKEKFGWFDKELLKKLHSKIARTGITWLVTMMVSYGMMAAIIFIASSGYPASSTVANATLALYFACGCLCIGSLLAVIVCLVTDWRVSFGMCKVYRTTNKSGRYCWLVEAPESYNTIRFVRLPLAQKLVVGTE